MATRCAELRRGRFLALAVAHHRLDPGDRAYWNGWVDGGVPAIRAVRGGDGHLASLARLFAAVRRPMPVRRRDWAPQL